MGNTAKVFYYEWQNLLKSRWIIGYTIFFLLASFGISQFSQTLSQLISGMLTIVLLVISLTGLVFGAFNYYESKAFTEFLLVQPMSRRSIFLGKYLALATSLSLGYVLGILIPTIPIYIIGKADIQGIIDLLILLLSGVLLSFSFVAIAFLIAISFDDKAKGFGFNMVVWLYLSLIHDGIILLVSVVFSQYPLEKVILLLTLINPVDVSRILIVLRLDIAALMGYTGAVLQKFFGSAEGMIVSLSVMLLWIIFPTLGGMYRFNKKDF